MPESFLGDGLVYEELLPVAWTPGPLPEGLALARLNVDTQQLLAAEASLDEVRVNDALKDESPALLHELAVRGSALPPAERVKLTSHALEWYGERAPAAQATGLLSLYVNPSLPQGIKIPCIAEGAYRAEESRVAQLRFVGLGDAVVHLLDKLIFRHHRRLVAGARHGS